MAMNFNRPAGAPTTAVAAKPETALMEVQPYDIIADQQATQKQLAHSPEIESLTAGIDVNDLNTIVTFGSHSAEEISKASDVVLRSMNMSQLDESSKMLNSLAKIMDQFDINEIRDNPSRQAVRQPAQAAGQDSGEVQHDGQRGGQNLRPAEAV